MNYIEFEKSLKIFPIFSVKDIQKRFPNFDSRRLVEWQKKGYIVKMKRGYYCFDGQKKREHFLYYAANRMYAPSYISLESALAHYNLIPEGVFLTISVTTKNTASYDTFSGNFEYRHLKPTLFFGYKLLKEKEYTIRMAEPEKVILDYFYLNKLNSEDDVEAMRFNEVLVAELVDLDKLKRYQSVFNSKILDKRIRMFLNVTDA
ncbi:MAG: hypothetical protein JKY53_11160 [Flavobacteriales bacterium]|nr:hypothetical protein [Flavobacteriales bacterium]